MGEHKSRLLLKSKPTPRSSYLLKMASSTVDKSKLAAPPPRQSNSNAKLVRCPSTTLSRLRSLHEAEWITLFTPVVPHPPSTALERTMDPFEPLGRALPRQVRHVPYRLDYGMTQTHADFLPSAGAIVIVICSTENVVANNSHAFDQQRRFARDVQKKMGDNNNSSAIPIILTLATNGTDKYLHEEGLAEFPALLTCNDYSTIALADAVQVLFGN